MTDEMIENAESRIYEVGYLLLPSIPEEQVSKHVSSIKKMIEDAGGRFISEEDPRLRHLAYDMTKQIGTRNESFKSAYFGWIKFELPAGETVPLKVKLDGLEHILRFLLIKTVREITYVPRVVAEEETTQEGQSGEEASSPVVAEELDKSIDALIAE